MLAAGIDIGTTTISGAVLDTESGRLLCSLTSPGGEKLEGAPWAGELAALSGYEAATGYGLVTHYYNMKNGLVPPGAVSLCTAPDYVAMRLCGLEKPRTHASLAASLGLFDLDAGSFDHAALAVRDYRRTCFPKRSAARPCWARRRAGCPWPCP